MLLDSTHRRWCFVTLILGSFAYLAYRVLNAARPEPMTGGSFVGMWYGIVGGSLSAGGAIGFETFAKSQKVLNLRRDPRITALVEDGTTYDSLRGVEPVSYTHLTLPTILRV